MIVELLPCPFCGLSLERSRIFSRRTSTTYVHPDSDCMANNTIIEVSERREDQNRVAAWNRRPSAAHPDQTSPMTVGPEAFFDQEMFAALRAEGAAEAYDDMASQHEEDAQEYNRRRDPGMANHQRKYAKAFRDKAAKLRATPQRTGQ